MFAFKQNRMPEIQNKLMKLPIDSVRPNPSQPRRTFDQKALEELAHSISIYGLMQPVVVRVSGTGFELIAGERRWRACKLLSLDHIDAVVIDADGERSACMALIENLQRENLHFFEEAESYLTIMSLYGLTQEQLAQRLSKSQSSIANKLRVLRLPLSVKQVIQVNGLTERHARVLLRISDEAKMLEIANTAVEKKLTVAETDKLVSNFLKESAPKPSIKRLFRDQRLFVNTIKNAVKDLQNAGVKTDMQISETESDIVITVKIPRSA